MKKSGWLSASGHSQKRIGNRWYSKMLNGDLKRGWSGGSGDWGKRRSGSLQGGRSNGSRRGEGWGGSLQGGRFNGSW